MLLSQVDGNTEERDVQEKFIDTLMKTMKNNNYSIYHQNSDNDNNDGIILQDLEKHAVVNETVVTEPAVRHQNGHIPNNTNNDQGQHLRYDVRDMYAQIGSFPNDSEL